MAGQSQECQLDDHGDCTTCKDEAREIDIVQCGDCKYKFHAVCSSSSPQSQWATKGFVQQLNAKSTKMNFGFTCPICLTVKETNAADVEYLRIRKMEEEMNYLRKENGKMDHLRTELAEIKNLIIDKMEVDTVKNQNKHPTSQPVAPVPVTENPWLDPNRVNAMKTQSSALVISRTDDDETNKSNSDLVEEIVVSQGIDIKKSFSDNDGNLVVICN